MLSRFILMIVIAIFTNVTIANESISLIPAPTKIQFSHHQFLLTKDANIAYNDPELKQVAQLLAEQIRPSTGFLLPIILGDKGSIILQKIDDDKLKTEGYRLKVTNNVVLQANTASGVYYASQTLRQLLPAEIYAHDTQSINWLIPGVDIMDTPRFGWRGMHLDVSRHFMLKHDVKRFIDTLASLKFNTFHWHLTDDHGWRIEIKKYPKLTEVGAWRKETLIGHYRDKPRSYDGKRYGGFYTQEDIKEIVAYATARHINIVPEIDMPGHMQAAIAAYPALGVRSEPTEVMTIWGVSSNILNMEENTVQFAKDVLAEIITLFPSQYIHVGGDEAHKGWWETSPRIQEIIKQKNLKNEHELQSWFIKQLGEFLIANDRRLIGWDEIMEGGLASDAVVMWWRGRKADKQVKQAALAGHDIVIAENTSLYFNHYQGPKNEEPLSFGGNTTLEDVYKYYPLKEMNEKQRSHVLGMQGQLWTEYISNTPKLEYMAFPRALALSEVVWSNPTNRNFKGFLKRLPKQEKRFKAAGINFRQRNVDLITQ